jgi:hypothetical protein
VPVEARGKRIVETASGKVVGRGKTKRSAAISAWIRNRATRRKARRRSPSLASSHTIRAR